MPSKTQFIDSPQTKHLSQEHKALLGKHLHFYTHLEQGKVELNNDKRKHFHAVALGVSQPQTEDEKAYRAYQLAIKAHNVVSTSDHSEDPSQNIFESLKQKLNEELLQIEQRQDISEGEKAAMLINRFSVVCAAVAIQPLPFADILILTPIQILMAERIASVRGMNISETEAKEILIEVGKVIGLGLLAQQAAIGLYKTILPGLGGFMSIPLVYGLTYGIGNVLDYNYTQLRKGKKASPEDLIRIFNSAKAEGKKEGQKHKDEVKEISDDL